MVLEFIDAVGKKALSAAEGLGKLGMFFHRAALTACTTRMKFFEIIHQMNHIGVNSWGVVALTGAAVGGVLAVHTYEGLSRFGMYHYIGPIVVISMAREFGPMLSAIMVTGRAGSAMTAEIGTMRITEQIDALTTLSINIHRYLMVPRLIATAIIMPFLSLICTFFGTTAGYLVSIYSLKINQELYLSSIRENVLMKDITMGLVKSVIFGILLSTIACYKGDTTAGGSKGVGLSTTQSVVYACVTIFIADYILSSLMFTS